VTAAKKLFIASVLLAIGFVVARLMGRPNAPWHASHSGQAPFANRFETKNPLRVADAIPSTSVANGARLVPDFSAENPYRAADASVLPKVQSSLNGLTASGVAATSPPTPAMTDYQPQTLEPRAKLRNEAPRPLDFDSRGPETAYTQPALAPPPDAVPPVADARSAAADWRASGLTAAQFVQDSSSAPTINASFSQQPDSTASFAAVSPPLWPELHESNGPRTHVIVDGDSLERLARRYLDDPTRGDEIYQANRELLASPDLLPIGAELIIPQRARPAALDAPLPQSSLAKDPSLRAATHGNMLRVRLTPPPVNAQPRAQLLPPVRAD
jgi:nucleoid-associated protein YgaU